MSENNLNNSASFKRLLRENKQLTLILVDIDNFRNINDSYGIESGDHVIVKILQTLHSLFLRNITIYKLESDEFALVNEDNLDLSIAEERAKLIISYFNETELEIEGELEVKVSFSIGIARGRGIEVLNNARLAIKELRMHTRGTYKVYDRESPYIKKIQDMFIGLIKSSQLFLKIR
ncbi:MAG: hypothetical protein COB42_04740 [Sulfurimonas sp.]|nr:MAG: hypothetical protein COB42_04740 [Sulfurimonas sp.]